MFYALTHAYIIPLLCLCRYVNIYIVTVVCNKINARKFALKNLPKDENKWPSAKIHTFNLYDMCKIYKKKKVKNKQ